MLWLNHYGLNPNEIINELKKLTERGPINLTNTLQKKVTDAVNMIGELEQYHDQSAQELIALLHEKVLAAKNITGEITAHETKIKPKTLQENLKKANKIIDELHHLVSNPMKPIEMLQKNLKTIFFPAHSKITNAEVLTKLSQTTFNPFPRLRYVLDQVFQGQTAIQIPENLKDWEPQVSFQRLNANYGYFDADLSPLFNQLTVACHKMTTLIEHQAFDPEMAYKLMALFYDPNKSQDENFNLISQKFNKLITTNQDMTITHPYHDAFVTELYALPIYNDILNLPSWQSFIEKEGLKALHIFRQCAHLQPAFANIQEAENFLMTKTYPRAEAHPTLAKLCKSMLISNDGFEAGLKEVETGWPKKETDNLPIVDIANDKQDYFWVKLPPQDMRAMYLGNMIPGCCQFINGDSQQCVKDGISLSDNGFYVLLKAKKVPSDKPRIIHHEINTKDFDIVAQSYAWKSQNGNLCLDSIEWNQARVTEETIQTLMSKFSQKVFEEHPRIKHITAGTGGQTPRHIYPRCVIHETMKQGYMYGDSAQQLLLSSNVPDNKLTALKERLKDYPQDFQMIIEYLAPYFRDIDILPEALLEVNPHIMSELPQQFKRLPLPPSLGIDDFKKISFADYQNMAESAQSKISTVCKIMNSQNEEDLMNWLPTIPDEDLSCIRLRDEQQLIQYSLEFSIKVIERLPLQQRLEALKEKNKRGETILFDFTSHPELFRKLLTLIPNEISLDVMKEKNIYDESILFYTLSNPMLFNMILERLPPQQLLGIIKEKNNHGETILFKAIFNPELLRTLLARIPADNRLDIMKEKNNHGDTLLLKAISNPELFKEILLIYPPENRLDIVKEKNNHGETILLKAISNPELFNMVLEMYPNNQKLEALTQKNILEYAAKNLNTLSMIFDLLSSTEQLQLLTHQDTSNQSIFFYSIDYPNSLKFLLDHYPIEQRLEPIKARDAQGKSVLSYIVTNPINFHALLEIFNIEQRLELIKEKYAYDGDPLLLFSYRYTQDPEILKSQLELLLPEHRLEAIKEKNNQGQSLLLISPFSIDCLKVIIRVLPETQLIEAFQEKNDQGQSLLFNAAKRVSCLNLVLRVYPPHERLKAVLEKDNDGQCILFNAAKNNPTSLQKIFHLLPPKDCIKALQEKNADGQSILLINPQLLENLCFILPEEIALALQSRKSELLANHDEVMYSVFTIQQFIDNMKDLAPPESIKNFVHALIQNEGIETAQQSLFSLNSASFFNANNQAIQACIDKLHPYWLSRIHGVTTPKNYDIQNP